MNALDVLVAARALIADEKNWEPCVSMDPEKHCSVVAIRKVGPIQTQSRWPSVVNDAVRALSRAAAAPIRADGFDDIGLAVGRWNDRCTHAEVLAAFDRAITNERAKAQEFTAEPVAEKATA